MLTGAVIVDNHLINNPVFSVAAADGKTPLPAAVWQKIESIRRIVLDTVAELAQPEASFIFTNVFYEGEPNDRRWYEDVEIWRQSARHCSCQLFCAANYKNYVIALPPRSEQCVSKKEALTIRERKYAHTSYYALNILTALSWI